VKAKKRTVAHSGAAVARGAAGEETIPWVAHCELNPVRPSLPRSGAMAGSGPSVNQTVNVQVECSILARASISIFGFGVPGVRVWFRLPATHGPWRMPELEPSAGGAQTMLALCCVQFLQGRVS
jgi:hypothetical protein